MAIYHMPHYDRELTFAEILYNLYINIMKFKWQKKHSNAQYILTVYLYSKLDTYLFIISK
jgi:transketolase N-terminal domain/subunit